MNLKEYLEKNKVESTNSMEWLPSVGAVLNTENGDLLPVNEDSSIDFDEGVMNNLMDMDISDESEEWYESLHPVDKKVVDETMDELGYQRTMVILGVAQKETDRRLTDLMEGL